MKKQKQSARGPEISNFRLNEQYRQTILRRALARAFDSEEERMRASELLLGGMVYDDVYPKEVQRLMSKMPEGFLPIATSLTVAFDGEVDQVRFGERRVADKDNSFKPVVNYESDHPIAVEHSEVSKRRRDLNARREKARRDVLALLESCRSSSQLLATWPEAAQFMDSMSPTSQVVDLAVPVEEINLELGLG